jgi:hypothetical protein
LLLISDVLGDVGQSPKRLPKSDRPAGEKRGQGSPDEEDRESLPEGGSPYHGEDHAYDDENDAQDPDEHKHCRP